MGHIEGVAGGICHTSGVRFLD